MKDVALDFNFFKLVSIYSGSMPLAEGDVGSLYLKAKASDFKGLREFNTAL